MVAMTVSSKTPLVGGVVFSRCLIMSRTEPVTQSPSTKSLRTQERKTIHNLSVRRLLKRQAINFLSDWGDEATPVVFFADTVGYLREIAQKFVTFFV